MFLVQPVAAGGGQVPSYLNLFYWVKRPGDIMSGSKIVDCLANLKGWFFLILIVCGLICFLAFDAIFYQYPIFLKDESFLSKAQSTTAFVIKDYTEKVYDGIIKNNFLVPEKVVYSFRCGKNCTDEYKEGKFARLVYQINGKAYENDVWVVFMIFRYTPRETITPLLEGTTVNILYNADDPNDIRLQDDIVIKEMRKSWVGRHGHWFWIVLHGVCGILCAITLLASIILGLRGHKLFRKCISVFK